MAEASEGHEGTVHLQLSSPHFHADKIQRPEAGHITLAGKEEPAAAERTAVPVTVQKLGP